MGEGTMSVSSRATGEVVLAVNGDLDADAARALLVAAASATSGSVRRIRIDLRGVRSVSQEGVLAVTGCRRLDSAVPEGVAFVVAGGAGSRALLASMVAAP